MAGGAKLAVWCDTEGSLVSVLHDELGVAAMLGAGSSIRDICDPMSREKVDRLFTRLLDEAAALDWRVNVPVGESMQQLHLSAARADERVLILATASQDVSGDLFEELIRINSDQANELRTVQKELAVRSQAAAQERSSQGESIPLNEFTRLNNELTGLQREMARKNSELTRMNEQKNEFLGIAAHDLRNPLGAISGFAKLLLGGVGGELADAQREIIQRIERSSTFMAGLVDDLLDYSKIEAGKLELKVEPCDIETLVREVVTIHEHHADAKHIALECQVVDPLPESAWVDAGKIEQVVSNLLSNAIKYSPGESRVTILLRRDDGVIEIEVRDQGPGIPEDEREQLFKPFETTSVHATAGEKSTGLGLSIVHRIVTGHAGEISVRSQVGEGSAFTVRLPIDRRTD